MKHLGNQWPILSSNDPMWIVTEDDVSNAMFPFEKARNIELPSVAAEIEARQRALVKSFYYGALYKANPSTIERTLGMKKKARSSEPRSPVVPERNPNQCDRVREAIEVASKNYADRRDAWKRANEELSSCRIQSSGHPAKVAQAALALNEMLGAAEELQSLLAKGVA